MGFGQRVGPFKSCNDLPVWLSIPKTEKRLPGIITPSAIVLSENDMASEKVVEMKGSGQRVTLEQLRSRITTYRNELRGYLEGHEANIETYKFSVEKEGDGFIVDVAVRASIHSKNKAGISK